MFKINKTPDTNTYIRTKNGHFEFTDIMNNTFDLEGIVHSLSLQCRFNGHIKMHYPTSKHSLYLFYSMLKDDITDPRLLLLALIHDFHEAFVGDMPTPLKTYIKIKYGFDFNDLSDDVDIFVFSSLGFSSPTPEEHRILKKYDYMAYLHERSIGFDSGIDDKRYYSPNGEYLFVNKDDEHHEKVAESLYEMNSGRMDNFYDFLLEYEDMELVKSTIIYSVLELVDTIKNDKQYTGNKI